MSENLLPIKFRDLEPFIGWALEKKSERVAKRLSSSMYEIQAFYDAMLPLMDTIIEYLDQFPFNQLPTSAERLFQLTLALVDVASAVESYKQPGIISAIDPYRFEYVE